MRTTLLLGISVKAHGCQPNITHLALRIASPGTQEIASQQTHWHNVEQVPAGKSLSLTSGSSRLSTYDTLAPSLTVDFKQAAAKLGETLDDGLKARAADIDSTDFSGGYDSTSLAFLALRHTDGPLYAYTHYDTTLPQGDLPYARQFTQLTPQLIPREFTTDGMLPFQDLRQPTYSEEPQPLSLVAGARDETRYRDVRAMGSTAHLNGEGGDAILDVPGGQYLADLYSQHHFKRLLQDGIAYARLMNRSPLTVWQESAKLAKSTLQQEFLQLAVDIASPSRSTEPSLRWLPHPGVSPLWLTDDVRNNLTELVYAHASDAALPENMGIADYAAVQNIHGSGAIIRHSRQIADPYNVQLHAPFLDHEVIRSCLALPVYLRADPYTFKPILREALAGMVPSEILSRQTKGDYTNSWYRGIREASVEIQYILNNSIMADLGIIKPDVILQSLAHDLNASSFPFVPFLHLMTGELWLRNLYQVEDMPHSVSHPSLNRMKLKPRPVSTLPKETEHYIIPKKIRPIVGENGNMALFNIRTNRYSALNPTGRLLLEHLSEHGSLQLTIEALYAMYPNVPLERLHADVTGYVKELVEKGILEPGHELSDVSLDQTSIDKLPRWDASLGQVQIVKKRENYPVSWSDRIRTLGAFSLALMLCKRPFETISETLEDIQGQLCLREATIGEGEHAQAAVHQITKRHFGRVACLELALTTAISLALQRRAVDFHIGAALDPLRFHAWASVQDDPVTTPFDPPVTGVYRSLVSTRARYS